MKLGISYYAFHFDNLKPFFFPFSFYLFIFLIFVMGYCVKVLFFVVAV